MSMHVCRVAGVALLTAATASGCGDDDGRRGSASAAHASAPRNGLILYQKQVHGRFQQFTIRPDGTGERQITHVPGEAIDSDWSPDGTRVVFQHDRPHGKGCAMMLADADGGHLTDLSVGRDCDFQPSFTPDGERIVFVRYDQKADNESIQSMDLTGGDARPILDSTSEDIDPNVSPDGRTLTFLRIKENEKLQALYAVDIDGRNVRRLTPYADEVARKHAWAPDGSRIMLTVNADFPHGRSANIISIRPDGSDRRRITRYTGGPVKGLNAFFGSYSPDGRHIVFRVERNDRGGLAIADPDGSHLRMITPIADPKPKSIDWGVTPASSPG